MRRCYRRRVRCSLPRDSIPRHNHAQSNGELWTWLLHKLHTRRRSLVLGHGQSLNWKCRELLHLLRLTRSSSRRRSTSFCILKVPFPPRLFVRQSPEQNLSRLASFFAAREQQLAVLRVRDEREHFPRVTQHLSRAHSTSVVRHFHDMDLMVTSDKRAQLSVLQNYAIYSSAD